jgi:hypothetical protein
VLAALRVPKFASANRPSRLRHPQQKGPGKTGAFDVGKLKTDQRE